MLLIITEAIDWVIDRHVDIILLSPATYVAP